MLSFVLLNVSISFSSTLTKTSSCPAALLRYRATIARDDKELRAFLSDIIKTYRADLPANSENLKHVRRMVKRVRDNQEAIMREGVDPAFLEMGIYVSDMAKNDALMKKYQEQYGGDFLKAMLDHSKHSLIEAGLIRNKEGRAITDTQWKHIEETVIGHDGPSLPGTWWFNAYGEKVGGEYAEITPGSKLGFIHAMLDRLDQGGLERDVKGNYQGGLRKISYAELGLSKGNLVHSIRHVFTNTHNGSVLQVNNLVQRVEIGGEFFANKQLPEFLQKLRSNFSRVPEIFEGIKFDGDNVHFQSRRNSSISLTKNENGTFTVSEKNSANSLIYQNTLTVENALTFFWNNL